jgi:nucleotide-binding universal stress UspA family protein
MHVIQLNIVTYGSRVYEELHAEAKSYLERLADRYIHPMISAIAHVRMGRPVEEILAEAKAERVDSIILPTFGPSFWRRVTAICKPVCNPVLSTLAQKLVSKANCGVILIQAKAPFDCPMASGRRMTNTNDMRSRDHLPRRLSV